MSRMSRDVNTSCRPKGVLTKLRPETLNNFRDLFDNRTKRRRNAAVLDGWAAFAECYKRDEVRMHARIRTELAEFCAIFQHNGPPAIGRPLNNLAWPSPEKAGGLESDNLNQAMLVRIVYLPE